MVVGTGSGAQLKPGDLGALGVADAAVDEVAVPRDLREHRRPPVVARVRRVEDLRTSRYPSVPLSA